MFTIKNEVYGARDHTRRLYT